MGVTALSAATARKLGAPVPVLWDWCSGTALGLVLWD
jgi:hypothetical protein